MARRRRTMARPPRKRRPADWVYRPHIRDQEGSLLDNLGTYEGTFITVASNTLVARVLYDSFNFRSLQGAGGVGGLPNVIQAALGPSAKAEGRNPLIRRVEGQLIYNPTTWALGSSIHFGVRFGIFEQDPIAGGLLIDPAYKMMTPDPDVLLGPATWANNRAWQYERRFWINFNQNDAKFIANFRFNVNRLLRPNECYAIFMDNTVNGVGIATQFWFRTLVSDEG